jgi:hypothetical protein
VYGNLVDLYASGFGVEKNNVEASDFQKRHAAEHATQDLEEYIVHADFALPVAQRMTSTAATDDYSSEVGTVVAE